MNDFKPSVAAKLKCQSQVWDLVIENPQAYDLHKAGGFLTKSGVRWWLIKHDSDFDDDGSLERPHIHLVIDYGKNARGSRICNLVGQAFGFEPFVLKDDLQVINPVLSIDIGHSRSACIRYLIHLDSPDKFQYMPSEVMTNDYKTLDNALRLSSAFLDVDELQDIVFDCKGELAAIASRLGASLYLRHRPLILDIRAELGFH